MNVSEMIKLLESDGWLLHRTKGSHRQYVHPAKIGKVTLPGKPADTLHPKTLGSILKQATLKDKR